MFSSRYSFICPYKDKTIKSHWIAPYSCTQRPENPVMKFAPYCKFRFLQRQLRSFENTKIDETASLPKAFQAPVELSRYTTQVNPGTLFVLARFMTYSLWIWRLSLSFLLRKRGLALAATIELVTCICWLVTLIAHHHPCRSIVSFLL